MTLAIMSKIYNFMSSSYNFMSSYSHRSSSQNASLYIKGSRPEWCISSLISSRDTPFWSETLDICTVYLKNKVAWEMQALGRGGGLHCVILWPCRSLPHSSLLRWRFVVAKVWHLASVLCCWSSWIYGLLLWKDQRCQLAQMESSNFQADPKRVSAAFATVKARNIHVYMYQSQNKTNEHISVYKSVHVS